MEDAISKLHEAIYMNTRMTLDFFMHLPDATYTNKERDGIRFYHNPILRINCRNSNTTKEFYDFKKAGFSISVNNHYQVIKFFNTLMKWLFDDAFNDLFLMGPTNTLMFNSDYKSLHTTVSYYSKQGTQVLRGVPSIVELDGKKYEGIHLFVNTTDYVIPLSFEEVGVVFSILKNFNFSAEVTKLLMMYTYVKRNDQIHPSRSETKTPFD